MMEAHAHSTASLEFRLNWHMDTDMDNASRNHSDQTGDISIYGPEDPVDDDQCFRPLDRYLRSNQESLLDLG